MLVSDLQTNIVNKIGLASTEAGLVLTYLTQGFRDLNNKIHFNIGIADLDILDGIDDYTIDGAIESIEDVTILGSLVKPDRVTREEIYDLRRYANSGTAQGDTYCYCLYGNLFQIYPTPTADSTMRIAYVNCITTDVLGSSDDLSVDLGMLPLGPLSKALEYYGLWQAAEYDDKGMSQRAQDYLTQYDKFVSEARIAVRRRSGRGFVGAQAGYPVRRGFPRRNDVYPTVSRSE